MATLHCGPLDRRPFDDAPRYDGGPAHEYDGRTKHTNHCQECEEEWIARRDAAEFKRAGKASYRLYPWRLWHDDAPRDPKPLPKPGIYPAWAWKTPRDLVAEILRQAVTPGAWHRVVLDEYATGRHPWCRREEDVSHAA